MWIAGVELRLSGLEESVYPLSHLIGSPPKTFILFGCQEQRIAYSLSTVAALSRLFRMVLPLFWVLGTNEQIDELWQQALSPHYS